RAATGMAGPARLAGLRAAATASDLAWTRKGGDALRAGLRLSGSLDGLTLSDLSLQRLAAALQGPLTVDGAGAAVRLAGDANGHGAWTGLGAPGPGDSRDMAAVKRAVRGFRIAAPGLTLTTEGAALARPLRLLPDAGGEASLAPQGGGYRLTLAGGGLPEVEADVRSARLVPGGLEASGRIRAALSIGPIVDGQFDAAGALRVVDGQVSFSGERCAQVQAARLEFGANDVTALKGQLCPAGGPLLALGQGDWRIAGRAQAVSADVPFLQARASGAAGAVDLGQSHGALGARMTLVQAQLEDLAPRQRFRPLAISGQAGLARDQWTAELAARLPNGPPIGAARLSHDAHSGRGEVAIDTGVLTFAAGGLQPNQLSPLAAAIGSPAQGAAQFTGRFDWTPDGTASGGVLHIPRLDFASPAGGVTGLSGDVAFVSLAPLTAAPGQVLRAQGLAAFVPVTGLSTTFGLDAEALTISGGEAVVGGGKVRIESLAIPLAADQPIRGVLDFEGVQLRDVVEASPFGDQMDLDAKVSGRVPFEVQDGKVRVAEGELRAIQPGRLSIRRTALSSVKADGAIAAPAGTPAAPATTDTVTDFAYQAMENLAFDTLDAAVDSRSDGRLGVLFHIVGRHDPPQRQELTLTWLEVIRGDFMNRKLPLPSGTQVNLTLDTTLNLDDLLKDYADYQRLRGSPRVQP
ncbi:MAG: YdbH domain-containing protein, partial [Phenylobacterium sp.]